MPTPQQTGKYNVYSRPYDKATSFGYLYDPSLLLYTNSAQLYGTGGFRPAAVADFAANISVSGLNLTVGNVTVTGGQISLIGTSPVLITNPVVATSGFSTIVGTPTFLVGNTGPIAVSGNFGSSSSSVLVTGGFVGITGSPLVTIANPILAVSGAFTSNVTVGNIAVTGGSILISNTAPIAVSGAFSSSVTVGNVAITGQVNTYNAQELALLSGISGALTSNLSAPAFVTGQVSLLGTSTVTFTNTTLNVATTGNSSTTISNPIGVSGVSTDVNTTYTGGAHPWNYLPVGGRAVNVTGAGVLAAYNTGDYAVMSFNAANGGILVNQGTLDQTQDNVTVWTASTGVATVATVSGINNGGFGVVLPNNINRRAWYIQNLSSGTLLVNFSATIPTTGAFNVLLKGGASTLDGNGASWIDSPAVYTGPVAVTGLIGASPAYICWQL